MFLSQWRKWLFKKFFKKERRFIIDVSHNKYTFLRDGNILNITYFYWKKKHFKRLWKQYIISNIKYGIAYFRILKKIFFWKMKKWQIRNSEISEILFRVFSFLILAVGKNRKFGFKNLEKNFRDSQDFRGFRVFDQASTLFVKKANLDVCQSPEKSSFIITIMVAVIIFLYSEAATEDILWKKVFWKISENSNESTCVEVSILINLQILGLQFYWKRDSNTGFFLWILRNF